MVRPFLTTPKSKFEQYVKNQGFECVPDEYNKDNSLARNYIRNVMMEHVKYINPGIEKVIRKKYMNR